MQGATVVILGFPTDSNSSLMRGPAKAPSHIRSAIANPGGNSFSEFELDLKKPGVFFDLGDVRLVEDERDLVTVENSITEQLNAGKRVLSLGGDHSITYPIIRGYSSRYPDLSIVHFDAHPDMYPAFNGNKFSHACPFARILENTSVSDLTQIGIRTMSLPQRQMADRHGVRVFRPSQLDRAWSALPSGPVYVTIDMDGLDPAFAPGVSHREPGGLTVREVLETVEKIPGTIVGADIVEFNPDEDIREMTAMVAAKFAKELIARIYSDAQR